MLSAEKDSDEVPVVVVCCTNLVFNFFFSLPVNRLISEQRAGILLIPIMYRIHMQQTDRVQ